jgi:hypothetical protein
LQHLSRVPFVVRGVNIGHSFVAEDLLCLDVLVSQEADFIKEIRYLAGLMRQNCQDASWRVERLLSKLEEGESLDTRSTSVQLGEARKELHLMMRGIEGIEKLCELESPNDDR